MAILQAVLSTIILGILYYRMIKREKPTQISWLQALTPIGLGMVSVSISFFVFVDVAAMVSALGISAAKSGYFAKSVLMAFLVAGCPEELTKLILMLIAIFLFRKRINNVYEYILIGAAIGIGFTIPEEFLYSEEGMVAWFRILTLAGHMVYGIIMAKHIGIAKYNKINGKSRFLQYALAIIIPILLHTLYDACTGNNLMLLSDDAATSDVGVIIGLVGTAVHFIGQFVYLYILKKNTEKYCSMSVLEKSAEN